MTTFAQNHPMTRLALALRSLGSVAALVLAVGSLVGCQSAITSPLGLQNDEILQHHQYMTTDDGPVVAGHRQAQPPHAHLPPSELNPVSLPEYRIEPPDILLIDAVRIAPKSPYFVQTLDILQIVVSGTLPDQPIAGAYQVAPDGTVNLGPAYAPVQIAGLTTVNAADVIRRSLQRFLADPQVSVTLLQVAGQQQIAGEHLVGPDGRVNLGVYGSVYVAGATLAEAREAIERHLSRYLDQPQVSVDVFAYNSKNYYVVVEGANLGDQVFRFPVTGNETVLDAIAQIGGISRVSSTKMWIARRAPYGVNCDQIIPVDYVAITKAGQAATNYQILPGDRVFIAENPWSAVDGFIARLTSPFERVFGTLSLGAQTIQVLQRFPKGNFNSL